VRALWRAGCLVVVATVALSGVVAQASPAASPATYRAKLNEMCRTNTVRLDATETTLARAKKARDPGAFAAALREYLGLGLRENAAIEHTTVPGPLRPAMEPVVYLLRRMDGHARGVLASMATGDGIAWEYHMGALANLSGFLDRGFDSAGLRDCGSNQS